MSAPFRRGLFSRIELVAGEAMPAADVTLERLRERIVGLRGDRR
jgi:hypothetical protein